MNPTTENKAAETTGDKQLEMIWIENEKLLGLTF